MMLSVAHCKSISENFFLFSAHQNHSILSLRGNGSKKVEFLSSKEGSTQEPTQGFPLLDRKSVV